jgi:hypothetical protein
MTGLSQAQITRLVQGYQLGEGVNPKRFNIPVNAITEINYGQEVHRHIGTAATEVPARLRGKRDAHVAFRKRQARETCAKWQR